MTYIPDLTQKGKYVFAGYLACGHEWPQGEVSDVVLDRLVKLGTVTFNFTDYFGYHHCDLGSCNPEATSEENYWRGIRIPHYCKRDIWVPDRTVIYNTPQMILHYIRAHRYLPPAIFLDAVLHGPEPGSESYRAELNRIRPFFGWG